MRLSASPLIVLETLCWTDPSSGRAPETFPARPSQLRHRCADVDIDDPNFDRTPYEPFLGYGRSKTANVLFAVEFDRRHRAEGVRAAAVHPGGINTELRPPHDRRADAATARPDQCGQQGCGRPAFRLQDHPPGGGDLGLGRRGRRRGRGRRPSIARTATWPKSQSTR